MMTIKVVCACETKYAFDVEPVNGQMPFAINCPACGADGTASANDIIRSNLSKAGPVRVTPKRPVAVASPAPPSVPVPPPVPSAPVAPAASPAEASEVTYCVRHPGEVAAAECAVCGKPICSLCLAQSGYVCSVHCRSQATARGLRIPVYEGQAALIEAKRAAKLKRLAVLAGVGVAALLGLWVWYSFWGSKPKVVYTHSLPLDDRGASCKLLAPDRLLAVSARRVVLIDVTKGEELWSTSQTGASLPQKTSLTKLDREDAAAKARAETYVFPSGQDVWVVFSDRVARFDLQTGKRKEDTPFPAPVQEVSASTDALVVVSGQNDRAPMVTRIGFADGKAQSEAVSIPVPPRPPTQASAMDLLFAAGPEARFYPSPQGVVMVRSRLLEAREVARKAMRDRTGPSTFEQGNISGANAGRAVTDLLNDMSRESTDGVEMEDASRYRVTLGRRLPSGSSDWTGEFIGRPHFYSARTLNLVAAGYSLTAFSKENSKLWEAKLTYPVWELLTETDDHPGPFLEHGGILYFYDHGTLAAFDAQKGEARWRLTSVGISQVVMDGGGKLVISTTTASPDAIKFSLENDFRNRPKPVIARVDPATGTVLWSGEQLGETIHVSGKYLYTTQSQVSSAELIGANGDSSQVAIHYRARRVDLKTGKELWVWYRPKPAHFFQAAGTQCLVQFKDEALVMSHLDW
jgi:outer membrane protein assembly factor BamB